MVRWNAQETEALTALRAKIDDVIKKRPQYPEARLIIKDTPIYIFY